MLAYLTVVPARIGTIGLEDAMEKLVSFIRKNQVPILALVLPCFNEEAILPKTIPIVDHLINDLVDCAVISKGSFACFVDDGSSDNTWHILKRGAKVNSNLRAVKLSRNFGHQSAVLAGTLRCAAFADCVISIDADLQQDVGAIKQFVESYLEGADIVLGVRNNRATDGTFKRLSAEAFYFFMKKMGVNVLRNHADYRLLSRKALEALALYGESNLFLRGLVQELGFRVALVNFDVSERAAGLSKYKLSKMLLLAVDGVTSFSIVPLRIVSLMGVLFTLGSGAMGLFVLISALTNPATVPGWASTVLPIYLIGGIQLLSIGILGEYVGKSYMEAKRRPRYIIEEELFGSVAPTFPNAPPNSWAPMI